MAGSLVRFELPSGDRTRAKKLWSGVFGSTFTDPEMPRVEYCMTQSNDSAPA
jgi:predicted enzyme related to lactoylglutathione lyase